jgi:hypothetical protein
MGFFEAVIRALLTICACALVFYLVVWVLAVIGLALPVMVEKILVVIMVLVAILILARLFYPWLSANWWGPR